MTLTHRSRCRGRGRRGGSVSDSSGPGANDASRRASSVTDGSAEAIDAVFGSGDEGRAKHGGVEARGEVRGADRGGGGGAKITEAEALRDGAGGWGVGGLEGGEDGVILLEIGGVAVGGAVDLEEFDKVVLFLPAADALEVEDLAEVGVVAVRDVDEVGLHESLRRGWVDLDGLEEGLDLGKAVVDALDEAGGGWSG